MKALIVLARLPLTASVKPRLAAKVTSVSANEFYRACVERAVVESAKCEGVVRYLFYSDGSRQQADEWMRGIRQEALQLQPQAMWTDAGGRICDAFREVFAAGAAMVVLISADVPDIDASLISNIFAALESSDVVYGPTHDGGFYLVGLKSHQPSLFEGIPWGTDKVLQLSISRAKSLGLTVASLTSAPPLYDIDTLESLVQWIQLPSSTMNPLSKLAVRIVDESQRLMDDLSETGTSTSPPHLNEEFSR